MQMLPTEVLNKMAVDIGGNSGWKWMAIKALLPRQIIMKMETIVLDREIEENDCLRWGDFDEGLQSRLLMR